MKILAKVMVAAILMLFVILVQVSWAKNSETIKLRALFQQNVGNIPIEADYWQDVKSYALKTISGIGADFNVSQYFVYVDRNPQKQFIFVCYYDAKSRDISLIGADKVSTGNPARGRGFFITPLGVYKNTVDIIGYRALGTKNDKNWRGYGIKGMRIWDFGWRRSQDGRGTIVDIRLLMHATDPDFGEQRLGSVDSKGCIRISHRLNRFLDHYGILDKEFEASKDSKKIKWLLRADREPVAYAGKYIIVGSSGFKNSNLKRP
ncbi:MAG: murein L,D-transpeptidase [Candidatus Niyogibacteria bacterium]|nr:murein L,D-transpeptidase [Candidatus Niyogibacteria bacterium]